MEAIVFTQADEDVAPQMTLPGYRFGKDLVPVAGADGDKIKYGVDAKLLQTIGVMPQKDLPRREQRSRTRASGSTQRENPAQRACAAFSSQKWLPSFARMSILFIVLLMRQIC